MKNNMANRGKNICKTLKEIRQKVAEGNNLFFKNFLSEIHFTVCLTCLFAMAALCGCKQKSQDAEQVPETSHWMDLYYSYISDSTLLTNDHYYYSWKFAYIDDDTIPEIILNGVSFGTGNMILTISDGKVVNNYTSESARFIPLYGLINSVDSRFGDMHGSVYLWENGLYEELFSYSCYGIDKDVMDSCLIGDWLKLKGEETVMFDSLFNQNVKSQYGLRDSVNAKTLSLNWIECFKECSPIETLLPTLLKKK